VQLLLGWFIQGNIEILQPALDQEHGIRYPALDPIVNDPSGAEPFLESLAHNNILEKHACGYVLSCARLMSDCTRALASKELKSKLHASCLKSLLCLPVLTVRRIKKAS
jgi:hypothetical protein